jgi:hypothetical protein
MLTRHFAAIVEATRLTRSGHHSDALLQIMRD